MDHSTDGDAGKPHGEARPSPGASGNAATQDPVEGSYWGFLAGLLTAALALAALAAAITTPPRSGPYCQAGCVTYPYIDVVAFVPRDYLWMYPALLAPVAFTVLAVFAHQTAPAGWRPVGIAGISFATMAAGILVVDYGLQLSVMQASLLAGESSGLSLLSQYNPHGVFIGLENVGYGALALAFVFLGMPLTRARSGRARSAGWSLALGGALGLLLLAVLTAVYQSALDVRFEVLAIVLSYLVLITAGTLLGLEFSPWRAHQSHRSASKTVNRGGEAR